MLIYFEAFFNRLVYYPSYQSGLYQQIRGGFREGKNRYDLLGIAARFSFSLER